MIFEFERRVRSAGRAEQLRQPCSSERPLAAVIMNGWAGVDRVILAMQAARPVGIEAVIAAFEAEPKLGRDAVGQATGKLDREFLLGRTANDAKGNFLMLAFPFRLERQVGGPDEAVGGEILLDDGLEFELELSCLFAGDLADPRPAGFGIERYAEAPVFRRSQLVLELRRQALEAEIATDRVKFAGEPAHVMGG